jgi:hypothetical protein
MANTVEEFEHRLFRLIDEKLPTNGRGEITAEVLRHTLKSIASEVFLEIGTLIQSARISLPPHA